MNAILDSIKSLTSSVLYVINKSADRIAKAGEGLLVGLLVSFVGVVITIFTGSVFEIFEAFSILIIVLGIVYSVMAFYLGAGETHWRGLYFSLGIIILALVLNDDIVVFAGGLSLSGLLIRALKKDPRDQKGDKARVRP